MSLARLSWLIPIVFLASNGQERTSQVALTVDTSKVVGRIDPKVYGQFYELIYHSGNGGLWGDMIFNRSFEEMDGSGQWSIAGDILANEAAPAPGARINFGNVNWRGQEFSFNVRLEQPGQVTAYVGVGEAQRGFGGGAAAAPSVEARGMFRLVRTRGRGGPAGPPPAAAGGRAPQAAAPGGPPDAAGRGRGGRGAEPEPGLAADVALDAQSWHAVRVRCEGNRVRWWLDDKMVGDVADPSLPPVEGRVGIAVSNAKAQFRGLKVTSLDGKPLLQGLPAPARHWLFYGTGSVAADGQQALNSQVSLHLTGSEGESGLQQGALRLTRNDRVRGSLWARGAAPQGIVVRLRDGEKTLMEKSLAQPTSEWKEYAIDFTPGVTVNNAAIQIGVKGKADVWLDQVSLMADSSREAGGFRPDLLKAVADIKPPIIRWPGGSFIGNYRWKDAIGPQSKRGTYPASMWDDRDANNLGTDEFMELCRRTGAEPLIVINIGHRDSRNLERAAYIQEALDWMEYCNGPASSQWGKVRAANGHPQPYNVKYWEISNETWSMGPDAYVQAVRDFVPPMRQKYPAIKIAVCGGSGTAAGNQRNWDETLLKGDVAKLYDYLSIHHYENADRFNEGVQDFDKHFAYLADLIRASENPKIKLDVSEWNVREGSDWRAGLYAGGLLNVFERRSDVVEIGGPALFMRHQSARNWDNAFINFDQTGWFPAPNYVVMKLWHDNFAPNLLAATGDAKSVNFTATKSEKGDKVYLKAVNPVGEAATVNVELTGGAKPTRAAMQLVAPGSVEARNSLAQPSAVAQKQGRATVKGNVVSFALPPLSVGVVVIDVAPTR